MILVWSTLPHYAALWFVAGCGDPGYAGVVAVSSTLSWLWHLRREPRDALFWADYFFAVVWAVYDAYLYKPTLVLNVIVLLANKLSDGAADYEKAHALWHLLSSAKTLWVANHVGCR